MQFIADNMLGKLAKWLRFMGYDVLYPKTLADKQLIQLSRTEKRWLLTRDKELAKTKDLDVLLIKSEKIDEQLKQVITEFNLNKTRTEFSRCPECNNLIKEIDKSKVDGKVPKGVYERQERFWICEKCDRYYWHGSHYDKIKNKLNEFYK